MHELSVFLSPTPRYYKTDLSTLDLGRSVFVERDLSCLSGPIKFRPFGRVYWDLRSDAPMNMWFTVRVDDQTVQDFKLLQDEG